MNPLDPWVRETLPRALAYARALLRDPVAAEDVVQDCYCRLIERKDRYDLPSDGLKILIRSVTNACIDHKSREKMLLSLHSGNEETRSDPADEATPDPHQAVVGRELGEQIEKAMAGLPVGQRAAVHLTCLGYTLPEVAEMTGVTRVNAGVLLHRARKALRKELGPYLLGVDHETI